MHCRKVRSCLSAFCKGELTGGRQAEIAEHLVRCPECRREEAIFRELGNAMGKLPENKVSVDFNNRLLNRIAAERFRETRTKAYMPKHVPIFGWGKLIPVAATVSLVLAFVFLGGMNLLHLQDGTALMTQTDRANNGLDDRYMTVQPEPGHALTQHVNTDWAIKKQVAKAGRIRDLMNRLSTQGYFAGDGTQLAGSYFGSNDGSMIFMFPFDSRIMNRTYVIPQVINSEETR